MDIRQRTRVQKQANRGSMEKIPDEVDCSRYSGMETI